MFAPLLEKLRRHEDLSTDEAAAAMGAIMDGQAQPSHIAGLLMALALKGERPQEMVGFARAMRARAVPLPRPVAAVLDTCGTGGDGAHTFNVSTAAALVVAGAGVVVAKHGNRAVSSKCGSADVFEALGVNLGATADRVADALDAGEHRVLLRARLAPLDEARGTHAAGARRPHGVQPAGTAHESRGTPAAAHRRLAAGTHRTGRSHAWRAGIGTSLGRSRCGWTRRALDARAHQGLRAAQRDCQHVLRASGRRRDPDGHRGGSVRGRRSGKRRDDRSGCSKATPVHGATSCSSMQVPRFSSPASRARSDKASSSPRPRSQAGKAQAALEKLRKVCAA